MGKQWTPPESDTPVQQTGWAPPATDEEVAPKKGSGAGSPHDFGMGYKPSAEDVKAKKSNDDLEKQVTDNPNSVKPQPPKGSWKNLPNFTYGQVFSGLEKDMGNLFGFAKDQLSKLPGLAGVGARESMGAGEKFWKDAQKKNENVSGSNPLPSTTAGKVATTVTKFVPDILELAATPELDIAKIGKLGEYAAKLGKLGTKAAGYTVAKFPIQQGTKKMLQAYSDAKDKGENPDLAALKGFGEGYKDGIIFEGAGDAAGKLTKLGADALEKAGLMSGKKLIAGAEKRLLHATAQGITFSAAPILQNAIEGKPTDLNEIKQNGIFGAVLGGISGYHGEEGATGSDKAAAQVIMRKPLVDLHNFVNADIGDIKSIHEAPASSQDLQAQSAAHAEQAFNSDEKEKDVLESSLSGKAASIKSITESIVKDKQGVIDEVNQMDLSDEAKQAAIDKINQVHKELDPIERRKTELADQIKEVQDNPGKGIIEQKEQKLKLSDLNTELDDIIKKQHEQAKSNKEIPDKQPADEAAGKRETTNSNDETIENNKINKNQSNEKDEGSKEESSSGREQVAARPGDSGSSGSEGDQNKEVNAELNREASGKQQEVGKDERPQENDVKVNSGEDKTKPETTVKPVIDQLKDFGEANEYPHPEKSKFAGKSSYDAIDENGYKISISPTKEGHMVALGHPGKDVSNVNSFNEIKTWFPENNKEMSDAINEAKTITNKFKPKENATKEQGTGKVDVGKQAENGSPMGEGNTEEKEVAEQGEKEKTTGIKKAISEATRAEKQLPEVKLNKLSPQHEVLKNGKELVESNKINPSKVAQDIISKPRTYTPDETEAMLYYGHQLAQQETTLRDAITDNEDPETHTLLHSNLQQLNDAIDAKTQADRINSREWSNLGNRMKIEADQAFSPATVRSIIKENYGGKIPKEVEERIAKAEVDRDKAIADLKKATENQIKKEGAKTVEKIRKSIKLVKQTKAELEQEASDLVKQLRVALKSDASRLNSGIPLPTETLAVLGKLAVNYFKQGIKDFEGLANRIHDDLKDTGVNKDDIREYLSNYEPLKEESRERHLELLGRKERSAEKQLATGKLRDYSRKPKINFKKDAEVMKAEQRVADAEYKIKQEKAKSYKADEGKYQRGMNWVIRWERRSVLASPKILEKLASAATIGSAVNRIPKQIIGKAFSAIFKGIADKAMIEGGLNMDAELKFWKEFTDPKKFVKNAAEILKTGASPLTRRFTEQSHEHYAGYDALMDLHTIIKDPPKRATFEASLRYAYDWAAKNNIDYTDPLIKRNLEMAAYKRANYEIFQENNGIAKRVNDFINSERKRTDAEATKKFLYRFLIPISTVPLNIARRIGSSVVGLPHGLYLAKDAYKKGIDNLSEEQADYVMRQLKNGSVGAAYLAVGLFSSQAIMGGLWNKDAKEGKKPIPTQAGFDEMKIGSQPIDKRIQHAMPLFLMQLGATTARVYNHYMDVPTTDPKYQTMLKSTVEAMTATTGAVVEEIPMIQEPKQAFESLTDPYERKKFGEDIKRRVGFSITDDLGITSKQATDALTKKLSTVTNQDGEKQALSTNQLKQRKDIVAKSLSTNPKDWPDPDENRNSWTDDFNDSWEDGKANKDLQKNIPYWKSIGRSPQYIKKHIEDIKQQKLDDYLERQAVKFSQDQMTNEDGNLIPQEKKPKNTHRLGQ